MNKIYKVMYSKVKQCAVVVSEIAKSHGHNGESSSVRKHAALMAAVLIALGSFSFAGMPDVQAESSNFNGEIKYYSVVDDNLPTMSEIGSNADNKGAKGMGSIAAGFNTHADGIASTVAGSYSGVINQGEAGKGLRGATALSYGTFNINRNTDSMKDHSGVANSIIGQANMTTDSNAALIYGAGNVISNSYRDIDTTNMYAIMGSVHNPKALGEALQAAVPTSGGQVMAFGGGNVVDNAYMTQVIGVGNTVKGNQKENDDGTWSSDGTAKFKDATSSQLNYVDGFYTKLINGKNDYLIGAHNSVTGDSVVNNHSNIVIGDYHQMTNGKNNVVIGSYDGSYDKKTKETTYLTNNELENAVILGHNANATVDGGVAIGSGSIANVGAGQKGYYVKHDQRSEEGEGYPFQNNKKYKPQSAWISKAGAVSVGDTTNEDQSKWITRQITGVAAGTNDTDAVNVAQLKNSQTRFYSIYDPGDDWLGIFPQIPNWEKYKNADNQGAQGYWSMAAGFGTSTGGIASTVIGSMSKIDNKWTDGGPYGTQGATAVSLGTLNLNLSDQVTDKEVNSDDPIVTLQDKEDSGVANSIIGQANLTKNSNGALIYGAGNIVTDSYRRVFSNGDNDWDSLVNQDMESLLSNPEKTIKTIGKVADISGGKAMVIGGGNVVDKAYDSQVMGVGNTVTGSNLDFVYKESPEIGNITDQFDRDAAREADVWTQYMESIRKKGTLLNFVDGYYSTLRNGQNDYLIGTANEVTGDDASQNKSNIVFGDYHKLNNGSNNIIIGSADGAVVEKAQGYNEDDEYGIKTSQEVTGQKQHTENLVDAVMIGHNADVQKNGGVALGAGSVASREAQVAGYDPSTKDASRENSATWKATDAAVSVGKADGSMTRQITGVAAGTELTDAVNVAQLQKALAGAKDGNDTLKSSEDALKLDDNKLSMKIEDTGGHTVSGSVDLSKLAQAVDTNTTYTLTGQANKDNTTTITLKDNNGTEDTVKVATKDTRNTVKAGENVTLDTKDNEDGSHEYKVNVKADGMVEAGSTKIVSGDTVYNETRVKQDGTYVKVSNTAGENLSALDSQVTSNTQSINYLNGRVGELGDRINKAAAGSNALAALHPLDYDPDDKADFAVGYGHYRNANAAAVGAFYHPNENTMVNVGVSLGNGDPGFNAGVSFKIGSGSAGRQAMSKTEMAKVINSQSKEIDALKKDNADKDKRIDALEQKMAEILAKLDKNGK